MSPFVTYEKFFIAEQAEPILEVLKDCEIPYEFGAINKPVDQIISGGGPSYVYEIKLPA